MLCLCAFMLCTGTTLHYFSMAQQHLVGEGLVVEASRSYSDTPHSVGLLWTRDQPVAETSTWQHSQQRDIHALGGIRTRNPSKRAAVDRCLRSRGHWDQHFAFLPNRNMTMWKINFEDPARILRFPLLIFFSVAQEPKKGPRSPHCCGFQITHN
jgi:hypothetical protein